MLPNKEQYVNHSDAYWIQPENMGKLTKGMNINEDVHVNSDISLLTLPAGKSADKNTRNSVVAAFPAPQA